MKKDKRSQPSAAERAQRYLSARPRTEQQVIRYLRDKGYEDDEIFGAVKELAEYHYIDDLRYSIEYFRYGSEKGRGLLRIRNELREKGVDRDTIRAAEEELDDIPDQYGMACSIAASMMVTEDPVTMDRDTLNRFRAKVGRRLAGRGFSSDVTYRVINDLKEIKRQIG